MKKTIYSQPPHRKNTRLFRMILGGMCLLVASGVGPTPVSPAFGFNLGSESKRYIEKGDELFEDGGYHGAVAYYQRALETQPDDWQLHLKLGRALSRIGRGQDSLKELFHSMMLNDKNPEQNLLARAEVAGLLMKDGNYDEAGGQLKQILDMEPENRVIRGNYAICLEQLGFTDAAIEQLKVLVESNPRDKVALYNLGKAYLRKGAYVDAARQFKMVVALEPSNVMAHMGLCRAMLDGGNPKGACQLAQGIAKAYPDNYLAFLLLGDALKKTGDKEAMVEAYKRAIQINPRDAACRKALAQMLEKSGKQVAEKSRPIY